MSTRENDASSGASSTATAATATITPAPAPAPAPIRPNHNLPSLHTNRIRLFGSSWTVCGYCKGKRSDLASNDRDIVSEKNSNSSSQSAAASAASAAASHLPSSSALPSSSPSPSSSSPLPSSKAYTVVAQNLQPGLYEALIEAGWRRSGRAVYRPDNASSCCPALSIRLRCQEFQPTKNQRKLLRQAHNRLNAIPSVTPTSSSVGLNVSLSLPTGKNRSKKRMKGQVTATVPAVSNDPPTAPTAAADTSSISIPTQYTSSVLRRESRRKQQQAQQDKKDQWMDRLVVESGLIDELQQLTLCSLRRVLGEKTFGIENDSGSNLPTLESLLSSSRNGRSSSFLARYKVVAQPKKKLANAQTASIVLSTSICAMVAGLCKQKFAAAMREQVHRDNSYPPPPPPSLMMDRGQMAAAVVRDLQQTTKLPETHWQEPPPDEPGEHPGKPHELRVERVEAHEPSGQVLVHVRVDSAVLEPHKSASRGDDEKDGGDDDDDVRMLHSDEEDHRPRHPRPRNDDEDDDARKTRGESNADGESRKADDRIGDWWRSRAALVAPESRSAGSASAAASVRWSRLMAAAGHDRAQGSVLRGPPPYVMSVTTLPAHESALDPDVHQLYWEYQHVVHGDPDPLEGVPEAPQAARGSVSHPPFINPGKHGADMSSNENAADQEMMNNMSDSNDDGESEDEDASSLGRWGRNAPDGWLSRAHAMLEAAYPLTFSGSHTSSASPESHLQQSRRKILARFGHFYEFLVENPFDSQPQGPAVSHERGGIGAAYTSKSKDGGNHLPPGSYHQHYRVGDVLVAVGVVDVLPQGLSSVYLFYDPAFARDAIPMGKYAILREIEYTRDILRLPCYYLGYYIESCPKMRYKIEYKPSELLCPVTFRWVDAEQGRQLLLLNSPQRNCCQLYFGSDVEVGNDDASPKSSLPTALEQIVMDVGVGYPVTLTLLQPQGRSMVEPILREFVQEAGSRVAPLCTILFL